MSDKTLPGNTDPLWYKDAVIYQLHVRSFFDSTNNGVGDFNGLVRKLDYLESLGVTAIWLLPFYPSPLRDDGYDIADYFGVHPMYGTKQDFVRFLDQAHRRGMRVITELVLNHTSDQHEWFRRSRASDASRYWRDFYVWSDTPDRYREARIIFKDFETSNWAWDPVAHKYYWHRFYSHQPDLNFENPRVRRAMMRVIDYWMELGVDGMRLDAVAYLYEKEGTNCENLPATYAFLRELRAHIQARYPDRMLLAEANQWPDDAAAYFGTGDICQMAFHFPLMPRIFMALQMEDSFPIIDILDQTPAIPETCQWGIFLRNHDELTLEMVTEEERDYMYRFYAHDKHSRINLGIRRRLAPLMKNSRRRIEIMNILLFSMPGTPIIYYGDEIGMGDNYYLGDRNGVRTPMQWSPDRNAGFSLVNPQKLFLPVIIDPEYHYESVNVETEERNASSLLWWMRRVIGMRRKYRAFSMGSFEMVSSDNANVLSFVRKLPDQIVLVVVNLSRFSQVARLDLGDYAGLVPVDLFSRNKFPSITREPYVLTMGFHDYFWFELGRHLHLAEQVVHNPVPKLSVHRCWQDLFGSKMKDTAESRILQPHLQHRTSAGTRPLEIRSVGVLDTFTLKNGDFEAMLLQIEVRYRIGPVDTVLLPVAFADEKAAESIARENAGLVLAHVDGALKGVLYDCMHNLSLHRLLFEVACGRYRVKGAQTVLQAAGSVPDGCLDDLPAISRISVLKAGRRNAVFAWDDHLCIKFFRRIEPGCNPELGIPAHLARTGTAAGSATIPLLGGIELFSREGESWTVGAIVSFVKNTGTAWALAIDAAFEYIERIRVAGTGAPPPAADGSDLFVLPSADLADTDGQPVRFCAVTHRLGCMTARLHHALSATGRDTSFAPEPFSLLYQRSLFQSMRSRARRAFGQLRIAISRLADPELARSVLAREDEVLQHFAVLKSQLFDSVRFRIHGDLHLGQFLVAGNEFMIKDFEGAPHISLSERLIKRSALRDVATLLHSLRLASYSALFIRLIAQGRERGVLADCADVWFVRCCRAVLQGYHDTLVDLNGLLHLPQAWGEMLRIYLLERTVVELEAGLQEEKIDIEMTLRAIEYYLSLKPLPTSGATHSPSGDGQAE